MSAALTPAMVTWLAAFTRTGSIEAANARTGTTAGRWAAWQGNADFRAAKTAAEKTLIADLQLVARGVAL
jgi:hypothetical protein